MNEEIMGNEVIEDAEASTAEEQEGARGERKYTDADVDRIVAKKIAAERNRMKKLFTEEQQESEIEKRERDVLKRELRLDALEEFEKRGIPKGLEMLVNYESKETCMESIDTIAKAFNSEVRKHFIDQISHEVPKTGSTSNGDPVRDAFFRKAH